MSDAPTASRETRAQRTARAMQIFDRLAAVYPEARTALLHANPFELLVATILSAQCTDRLVNQVTPHLFARFPTPAELARAEEGELETLIRPVNYYKTKARRLREVSRQLLARHHGEVPATIEELVALPGVGRKTANVVLGSAFGKAIGLVVDTHVRRVAGRLKLTEAQDPVRVEQDLMALLPSARWIAASHQLILHGRQVCVARRPRCFDCVVADLCPSAAPGAAEARAAALSADEHARAEDREGAGRQTRTSTSTSPAGARHTSPGRSPGGGRPHPHH